MVELLQWAAGLGTIPKVLAALVATAIWLFILVVLFSPKPRLATPPSTAPSISQQSRGPNSPNIMVQGGGTVIMGAQQQETLSAQQESLLRAIDELQIRLTAGKLIIARNGDVSLDGGTFARPTGVNLVQQLFGEPPPPDEGVHPRFVALMDSLPPRYMRSFPENRYGSPFVVAVTDEGRSYLHNQRPGGSSLPPGGGGMGGSATVTGGHGTAIGGQGGGGGVGGRGGDGGSATVTGDHGFAMGGEGGEAGQADRGGRGGRSPLVVLEEMGLGDDITRFMLLYGRLRQEYVLGHDGLSPGMISGTEPLPEEWANRRLQELGHPWRVRNTKSGFELYDAATGGPVVLSPPHP